MHEIDESGKTIHYSPYDGKIHDGVFYTDNGFWDTFRTVYPFYSIVYPQQEGEIIEGFLQAYREGGWLPQWPSPAERKVMIGDHIDPVIADAVVKGIEGFDIHTAYDGMRKGAFEISRDGREGLRDYLDKGFIPMGHARYDVSAALDYAYDDWCVAQVAKHLGKNEDAEVLTKRAANYRKSWDASVGFMREKKRMGRGRGRILMSSPGAGRMSRAGRGNVHGMRSTIAPA